MAVAIASFIPFNRTHSLSYSYPRRFFFHPVHHSETVYWGRKLLFSGVNCVSERSKGADTTQSELDAMPRDSRSLESPASSSSSPSPSSSAADDDYGAGIHSYKWLVALGGVGFLETAYLTYLKLTDSVAFCPLGEGSCTPILTSDYSNVFGVPLPLLGMLAYGLVVLLGIQLGSKERIFDSWKSTAEIILIGTTTSMAAASAYFLYILGTEFSGEFCLYCLVSVILSFSLFLITLKNSGSYEIQKTLGQQIFIAGLVFIALTVSHNTAQLDSTSLSEMELPYVETEIIKRSSPVAIALARHLRSIGAKVYGAFWCTHCQDQKEMFGREAAKLLDYVECFPDGVMKGSKMAQACLDPKLQGFPTWEINGQLLSGEKQFSELAELSGIKLEDLIPPT